MTVETATQPIQNLTANQSKNKRKKNRKKNKKSSGNGLASPVDNTIEPNVTSHVDDLSEHKTGDHPLIDKSSVPISAMDFPITSSFLSELNSELDIAFGSNILIDKMDQSNSFRAPSNNVSAAAADIPEKDDEVNKGLTESIKSSLVNQTESVTMETMGDTKPIETPHTVESTETATQQNPDAEEEDFISEISSLSSSATSLTEKVQEVPILRNISVASIQKNEEIKKEGTIRMVSPISDDSDTNDVESQELKSESKNDSNVISAAEKSFFKEKMDENGGLSDKSKNKSSEFPLYANASANDLSSSPMSVKATTSEINVKNTILSDAVSSAIHSAIASRCIDTEHIINQVVHNLESGKYRVEPRDGEDVIHKVDKSGSRTVVSSNVYKHVPSIEVLGLMEETVQCPEPAVGNMGQRMPSSMKTADNLKAGPVEPQRKSAFTAAFRRRNCIIL